MSTIKLHKDYLLEELNLPYSAIKDTITSTSRWSENHEIIFANDGKFYKTDVADTEQLFRLIQSIPPPKQNLLNYGLHK